MIEANGLCAKGVGQADASLAAPKIGPHDHAETLIGRAARRIRKHKAQIGLQQGKAGRVWPLHRSGPGGDPSLVRGGGWLTAKRSFDHGVDRRLAASEALAADTMRRPAVSFVTLARPAPSRTSTVAA